VRPPHVCPRHKPGTTCYNRCRCRCDGCLIATRRISKRSNAGLSDLVDAAPARERIRALKESGWTTGAIARAAGLDTNQVLHMATAQRTRAAKIAAVLSVGRNNPPVGMVDSAGTRRRLQALGLLGWRAQDVAELLGVTPGAVSHYCYTKRVTSHVANNVKRVTGQLWPDLGPSESTRARSARKGWAPLAAWDDLGPHGIDNPKANPHRSVRNPPCGVNEIEWMADAGEPLATICRRLGIERNSLYARCTRAERLDLWQRLTRDEAAA